MTLPGRSRVRRIATGALAQCTAGSDVLAQSPRVLIDTDAGQVTVELFASRAPLTSANSLRHVTEQRDDGGAFYRVVTRANQPTDSLRIEVIRGGLDRDGWKRLPAIAHEAGDKTGIRHVDGTISMARGRPAAPPASSSWWWAISRRWTSAGPATPTARGSRRSARWCGGWTSCGRFRARPWTARHRSA